MDCKTPVKNKLIDSLKSISIPPSPVMQKLGCGTGVIVYKMLRSPISNSIQSPWALKKIAKHAKKNKILKERLQSEADILRRLQHPNIVGFRAFLPGKDGAKCLAMEDCCKSLGDLIEIRLDGNLGMFPAPNIIKVARDVACALDYLHNEALILHCDIKSYNVLIKGDFDVCKVCDFGVCLPIKKDGFIDDEKVGDLLEYTGTLAWCSPEVLEEVPIISTKADIYAFGLTLWEMLALEPPLQEEESIDESFSEEDKENSLILPYKTRRRPDLPNVQFDESYTNILEIFYCCTMEDYNRRPNADDLVEILSEIGA